MKNNKAKEYCYEYFDNLNNLISKLSSGKYKKYLFNYYGSYFSIGLGQAGHGSGAYYKATIERKDGKYIISGTLDTYPKKRKNKTSILDVITIILLVIFFIPMCVFNFPFYFIVWVIRKINKDPFATYSYKKRLDYFMINYLGCVKSK